MLICCVHAGLTDANCSQQLGRSSAVAKECTLQIQKLVLHHLNNVVATQLLGLVDGLRSSCIGCMIVYMSSEQNSDILKGIKLIYLLLCVGLVNF